MESSTFWSRCRADSIQESSSRWRSHELCARSLDLFFQEYAGCAEEALFETSFTPLVQCNTFALFRVVAEDRLQVRGEHAIVSADIALLVESKRPRIEIRRTDGDPGAVHDHRFLVEHRRVVFINVDAGFQQPSV